MDDKANAQTFGKRTIVNDLDRGFARLHANSCAIIENTPVVMLYALPGPRGSSPSQSLLCPPSSVGESVLRAAAAIEQTFGGITANLWDDPFEWTLPEYLATPQKIKEHLAEVEALRRRAFSSFTDDACLIKHVAVPTGQTQPLTDLLSETLRRAEEYQAQARGVFETLSGISPAGFII